jgi:hypothetical protein
MVAMNSTLSDLSFLAIAITLRSISPDNTPRNGLRLRVRVAEGGEGGGTAVSSHQSAPG